MLTKENHKFKRKIEPSFLLPAILVCLLLGFFVAIETEKLLLFPITTIILLTVFFLFHEDILSNTKKKKERANLKLYCSFYEDFYQYSCLLHSYTEGFKEAFIHLEISDLKDKLTDYQENHGPALPLKLTNSFNENQLLDFMQYHLYQQDEPSLESTLELSGYLRKFQEENLPRRTKDNPYFFLLLSAAVYFVGLYLALKG